MAASDYAVRGTGVFCSTVVLTHALDPLDDTLTAPIITTVGGDTRVIGEGIILGDEIVRLTEVGEDYLKIARGCMDTIPKSHDVGEIGFFYEEALGGDQREYAAGETIGVKVLPHTNSSPRLPIENAPPNALTFDWRFIRPYAPGKVLVNGVPWYLSAVQLDKYSGAIKLIWAHRNRVTQADQLIDHNMASITPEAGQTYRASFFTASGVFRQQIEGITEDNLMLRWYDMLRLYGTSTSGAYASGYLLLEAMRDGYASRDAYRIDFTFSTAQPYGLGCRLGESLGGNDPTRPYGLGGRLGSLLGGKSL